MTRVLSLDLAHGDTASPRPDAGPVRLIFRWRGLPLGARTFAAAELPLSPATVAALGADLGAAQLAARDPVFGVLPFAGHDGRTQRHARLVGDAPDDVAGRLDRIADAAASPLRRRCSVIVCTRDRPTGLASCLDSLARLDPMADEIIVVDNDAAGSARAVVSAHPHCRYVHEPRPGLSVARNAGIRAATGNLIAFTDDDARPDPGWMGEMERALTVDRVDAVTGLVLPAELDSEAQRMFEFGFGGLAAGFLPLMFDERFLAASRPHAPAVWRIGAGANMAFRREALARVGLFDERLGAGAAGCSEDSELWYRILAAGGRCLYEPRCVVHHRHRADMAGLRRQIRAYMRGHVAALIVQHDRYGSPGDRARIFRALPRYLVGTVIGSLIEWHPRRLRLALDETAGWLAGTTYWFRRGWRRRATLARMVEVRDD
ncbi:glycosyltransferase family 2 protein [uncultured Sphingomonas sp.]|uniref:glycosyltransferase family 2 protein n=1 Tax=uncultured Sphingomonas sp. TaxID=158754 RepID=UPI0035C944C0